MSAFGTKRTCAGALQMTAFGVKRTCRLHFEMSAFDAPDYARPACLILVSYRRQFKLENGASVCPGGYTNPTVMVFDN